MATGYQPGAGIRVSFACLRRDQSTAIIHFRQAAGTVLRAVDGTECRHDAGTALGAVVWGLVARERPDWPDHLCAVPSSCECQT